MIKACDECIHKGICKLEDSYNYILKTVRDSFEDFTDVKDIFEIQLTCSKKTTTFIVPTYPGFRVDCTQISTYPED